MFKYLIITIVLMLIQYIYLIIAKKYNIIDKPNDRSSHSHHVIRGAGVIFPIAILLWALSGNINLESYFIGLIIISLISFFDDMFNLGPLVRFSFHIISSLFLLYQFNLLIAPVFIVVIILIVLIGWLNAFNFMDGINGISIFYSIVILFTFRYINIYTLFIDNELLIYIFISLLVFSFLNVRRNAIAFAGDVGSFSLSFILAFLMFSLILKTGNISYILLFSIYGIDTVLTIFERLYKRENIFSAHRKHLFQLLANEKEYSFLTVSLLYAGIQLVVNIVLIFYIIPSSYNIFFSILMLILISLLYLRMKTNILFFINNNKG